MMEEVLTIGRKEIKQTEPDNVLVVNNLYKSFGDNHVLVDFTLSLRKGENVAVLGK